MGGIPRVNFLLWWRLNAMTKAISRISCAAAGSLSII